MLDDSHWMLWAEKAPRKKTAAKNGLADHEERKRRIKVDGFLNLDGPEARSWAEEFFSAPPPSPRTLRDGLDHGAVQ